MKSMDKVRSCAIVNYPAARSCAIVNYPKSIIRGDWQPLLINRPKETLTYDEATRR